MRILVTGGAGFIGKHLVSFLLKKDFTVTIFDNFSNSTKQLISPLIQAGAKMIEGDIVNHLDIQNAVKEHDVVIHLAAKISVSESIKNPAETFRVNVDGTKNVLTACTENHVKKFIALSSAAVYGDNNNANKIFKENDEVHPISPYGQSKLDMENEIIDMSKKYNLNSMVLRLFNVYGKGQTNEYAGVISKFANCIKKNTQLIIFGDGNQTRDFVTVEDVINLISEQITSKFENTFNLFNIGSGQSTKIIDLANLMIKISDKKNKIIFEDAKEGDIVFSKASIEKAKQYLGYKLNISLNQGIGNFLES
ncbi:MAG: NAD-dependent epimerase/dehydratase family protein [Candidatus Nitrosopumilus sp. Bin_571-38]